MRVLVERLRGPKIPYGNLWCSAACDRCFEVRDRRPSFICLCFCPQGFCHNRDVKEVFWLGTLSRGAWGDRHVRVPVFCNEEHHGQQFRDTYEYQRLPFCYT